MTLVIAQFIKEHLPTPEEQLKLFKEILERSNKQRSNIILNLTNITFNWLSLSDVKKLGFTERNRIIKLEICRRINKNTRIYDEENHKTTFLKAIWYNELVELGLEMFKLCDKRKTSKVSILKPEALLEKTYISFVEREEKIYLVGIIGIYFNS